MRAALLFTMALTPFLLSAADETAPEMSKTSEGMACQSPFHAIHVDVRHTESKGVGYKDGYTTLEGFGIYDNNPSFMPFLDLRGHVFNNGQLAGNIGLGERTVIPSINHVFGLYLYYDVRQEEHGLTVNQLSPGVEVLGKRMEYRLNAYFPVGRDESRAYQYKFRNFENNQILLKHKRKYAMTGVDGEVGAHITQSTRHDFYFGIGPYYFTADPNNMWGGKTRLYWRYKDYISLEASYSYDHIFKNVVQGSVAFSYPFGKKLQRKGRNCPNTNDLALSRAAFAPYRFEIPVVETHSHKNTAINPATGQPWKVWFVNNTSHSNGTYESPFSTLVDAQHASGPNDMIYVFQGDGTSNGMDAGITLQDNQKLFGSGIRQMIHTTKGRIHIPAQTASAPTISSSGTDVIMLANGNEISGMNLTISSNSSAIYAMNGTAGINGANIHDNSISTTQGPGIGLSGYGQFNVNSNTLVGGSANSVRGISLVALGSQPLNVNVTNNTLFGYNDSIALNGMTNITSCSGVISGNTISNFSGTGITLTNNTFLNSEFTITNNFINNNNATPGAGEGITVYTATNNSTGSYNISNNTINTTRSGVTVGIRFDSINGTTNASARVAITNNNIVTGLTAGSYGLTMDAGSTITFCATITNNQIPAAAAGTVGLSVLAGAGGLVNLDGFCNNVTPLVQYNGRVALLPPGTCDQ